MRATISVACVFILCNIMHYAHDYYGLTFDIFNLSL